MKPKTLGVARGRPGCKCGRVRGTGWREPRSWCMGLNQYPPPLGLPQPESTAEELMEPGGLLPIPFFQVGSRDRKEALNNELTPTGVTVGFAGGSGRRGLRPLVWMGGRGPPLGNCQVVFAG